jgi:hypothetical protein
MSIRKTCVVHKNSKTLNNATLCDGELGHNKQHSPSGPRDPVTDPKYQSTAAGSQRLGHGSPPPGAMPGVPGSAPQQLGPILNYQADKETQS